MELKLVQVFWWLLIIPSTMAGRVLQDAAEQCSGRFITISQKMLTHQQGYLQFHVEILNDCPGSCAASQIHLHCGQFSSFGSVDPAVFHRVADDDCLLLSGKPLAPGYVVGFHYLTERIYPISFKSAMFCS